MRASWLVAVAVLTSCSATPQNSSKSDTPAEVSVQTRRDNIVEKIHGVDVADPYRWLEDVNSPEVQAWMNGQDDVARSYIEALPGRDALAKRFAELYYVDSISAPRRKGNRYFYTRRHADQEKAVYYFREGADGEEQVLLDPNTLSEDGSVSVGFVVASWDGNKVAYSIKENNADEAVMHIMDVATRTTSDIDVIPGIKYSDATWTLDGTGFYYTYLPTDDSIPVADRPGYAEIRFHTLGTDPKTDPLIKERTGDPTRFVGVDLSWDGRWLISYEWRGWNASDVWVKDLSKPDSEFVPFVTGQPNLYSVIPWKDDFLIFTNDGASRWRLFKTPTAKPARENWKEIIPEFADGSVIENVQIIGDKLVLTLLKDVTSDLRVFDFDGKLVRDIELPGVGASFGMAGRPDDDEAYFSFQSFTIPMRIYKTSIKSGTTELWNEVKVPIDPSPYVVEQVFYPSKDGTKIPMFVVHRKDMPVDGSTPFILYGYGGFSVTMSPYFRASIYPWLEAGGGYAVANLRGGAEYGEAWHQDGMLHKKQNVFDDFAAGAQWLIDNGYTSAKKLGIRGGSNGGLLVGAAMTQNPDLYGAVVCEVPLLDMIRYTKFGSGKTWISEYGDPDIAEDFQTLIAYSPYHHVEPGTKYPALLMKTADSDDRVDPMHARKFVAEVQYANGGENPVLMRVERNAGHGGADLIRQYVQSDADTYAFLAATLGLDLSGR
ncbi:MAG: prolyl oligopeptidase family serine peptidase [bacterium]